MDNVASVAFRSELDVRSGPGKNEWLLLSDFIADVVDDSGSQTTIVVPAGYITDLASVPRLPGLYTLFGGRARKSAVLHDWLYTNKASRSYADAVLFAAMRNEEGLITRGLMWLGVRLGGWTRYTTPSDPVSVTPEEWRG